jgi:hypothetical protein
MPLAITAVLLAVLIPIGFLTEDPVSEASSTPFAVIAERVERLRGERFRELPRPLRVTAAQAQREGLADFDRVVTPARRRADEALYTLLGLLPAGTDIRDVQSSVFGEQVAGYYDPRTKRLRVVEGAGTSNRVLDEMVLAHELTHALDDQAIGLNMERAEQTGDAAYAYTGVVEGVATQLMYAYVERHFDADVALGGLLGGAFASSTGGDLPPFILASLTFPYLTGDAFVEDLLRRAGGRWTLVNLAEGERPPASTEQLMHPARWIAVDAPQDVGLPAVARALGPGYRRLTSGVFGEWQTSQLLGLGGGRPGRAAAGWGGDAYALYRRDAAEPCATPCRSRDVLVMRWQWDTPGDAREFADAVPGFVEEGLEGRPAGEGAWTVDGAAARVSTDPRRTTLVLAPSAALARRLAG